MKVIEPEILSYEPNFMRQNGPKLTQNARSLDHWQHIGKFGQIFYHEAKTLQTKMSQNVLIRPEIEVFRIWVSHLRDKVFPYDRKSGQLPLNFNFSMFSTWNQLKIEA